MRTNQNLLLVAVLILLVTSCIPAVSTTSFPTVESTSISPYIPDPYKPAILTPDGEYLTRSDLTQVNLSTGATSRPFDSYLPEDWRNTYYIDNMMWLPGGKQLVVSAHAGGSALPPVQDQVFIIDTQAQALQGPLDIGPILSGSPFGRRILANPLKLTVPFWQVYDLDTLSLSPISSKTVDLESQETGGMEQFLWSQEANMPIATIDWKDPINAGGTSGAQEIGISKSIGGAAGELNHDFASYVKKFTSTSPDNAVNAIFDPQGQYILIVQWKCSESDANQCSLYPGKEYFNNVTDTVLILLDWRTGKQQELLRLSQVDPHNVIARSADWSANGNTVVVWRKDASPLILKIKYP